MKQKKLLTKLISGGQTGVDRAALDCALELKLPCGGWCPKGRLAEDGILDDKYPLTETRSTAYAQRTEWNVRDADGTLVLTFGEPQGGTKFTISCTKKLKKPFFVLNLEGKHEVKEVLHWIQEHQIHVLNIAGPRESSEPGIIYSQAKTFIMKLFSKERTEKSAK